MMGQFFSRPLIGGVLAVALGLGTGCVSHWIELAEPKGTQTPLQTTVASDLRVPLLIETIHTTQNGVALATPIAVEHQILGAFESTKLFSQHFQSGYAQPATNQPYVTIRLTMNNSVEPHTGDAAWSGFVIGASMFLLAPIVTLDYDYGTQMALEVERWDGQTKQYQASSSGTAHYHLFAASQHLIDELKGQVTETCLTQLLDQVIRDTPFYVVGEIAPSETTMRSVSVGTKRSNSPAHPVSTSLEPATR
jgi:hypothetical protein